jgi:thiazole biosynthesis enzyme
MKLDDVEISRAIIESFYAKLLDSLECDAAIVGGGPAGLTAAYYMAKQGRKVVLFERKLSVGGGMWGGGIMFNEIVVQQEGKEILDEFGIGTTLAKEGYFCADSVETASTICSKAAQAGARIFNLFSVEDVMMTEERVNGLVINWSAVEMSNLHVDPISVRADYVVDATGHAAEVAHIIEKKSGHKLMTPTGTVVGERPMHAELAERNILENTKEIFPGVFAAGMCCNAVFGAPRMGPIFGGMLMSGKKVAELILAEPVVPKRPCHTE